MEKLKSLLVGQCLSSVALADQWLALARVVGVSHGDGGVTLQLDSAHSSGPPKLQRPGRHSGLKTMALTSMANLGGQATSKQLRKEIEKMPESSTLSSDTVPDSRGIKLWESMVRFRMAKWFERTETPRVFRLKGSTGSASPVAWSVYTKRSVGLKAMALTAMADLGGQATTKQRREEMERMPESSTLCSATSNNACHKGKMWHVTVVSKMGRWFEGAKTDSKQCAAKGVESKRRCDTLWRLRGTALVQ